MVETRCSDYSAQEKITTGHSFPTSYLINLTWLDKMSMIFEFCVANYPRVFGKFFQPPLLLRPPALIKIPCLSVFHRKFSKHVQNRYFEQIFLSTSNTFVLFKSCLHYKKAIQVEPGFKASRDSPCRICLKFCSVNANLPRLNPSSLNLLP